MTLENHKRQYPIFYKNYRFYIFVVGGIFLIFFIVKGNIKSKPSVCDCDTVFQEYLPPLNVVERIMNEDRKYITGNPIERAQRECRLKWSDEITKKYGSVYSGNNTERFFSEECSSK